jgi:hypothetical protein
MLIEGFGIYLQKAFAPQGLHPLQAKLEAEYR